MAIAHTPKAGQWSKRQAKAIHGHTAIVMIVILALLEAACGFVSGVICGRPAWGEVAGIVAYLLLMVAIVSTLKWADKVFEKKAKEQLRYLRGGQAEAFTTMLLRNSLPSDWHVFDNVKLDANSDVDHVLIGPRGLFVISVKSERGMFRATADGPQFNLKPTSWPREAMLQALRLREQLKAVTAGEVPYIQAVLALPFAYIEGPGRVTTADKAWILHKDNLIDTLERHTGRMTMKDAERLIAAAQSLCDRWSQPARESAAAA